MALILYWVTYMHLKAAKNLGNAQMALQPLRWVQHV